MFVFLCQPGETLFALVCIVKYNLEVKAKNLLSNYLVIG